MSANCARPGCGHTMLIHGIARCQASKFPLTCDCPGHRTAEQQQAWEEARLALGPAVTEVPARMVKRLLELYP